MVAGEELARVPAVKTVDDVTDKGADAFGERFVVRARLEQLERERVVLVPENDVFLGREVAEERAR